MVHWKDRSYTIYAVDFDGTLCKSRPGEKHEFPGCSPIANTKLINQCIEWRKNGDKVILYTIRSPGLGLEEAVEWCRERGLEFDAINDNLPKITEFLQINSRKVAADIYIDDSAEGLRTSEYI
jgi:hypothetical protein